MPAFEQRSAEADAIRRALLTLPFSNVKWLLSFVFSKVDPKAMPQILDLSVGTVKSRLSRAMAVLHSSL